MPDAVSRSTIQADLVDVADLRLGGDTAGSLAEEIAVQHRTGYTTAVAHVNSRLVSHVAPANTRVRQVIKDGKARLILPGTRVRARIAVFHHPAVVEDGARELPAVDVDSIVLVANVPPVDGKGSRRYAPTDVARRLYDTYGVEPTWAPVGRNVRGRLADELPRGAVLTDDWVNIIDVDAWRVSRTSWRSDRPVIGRCGGTGPLAWPSDPRVVRAAYPTDGSWTVRVLSRPGAIVEALGTVPDAWDVLPPHSLSGREFLASLDFFVYFYDSRWAEPSRRPILEAITTGVLAVVPPELEEDFGDAAVYAEPESLRRIVDGYFDDRPAYERQVAEAERIVRERFSGDVHLRRLRALIGDPSGKPAKTGGTRSEAADGGRWRPDEAAAAARRRGRPVVERQRILMVTSNGSGMGHLTRLLAMSRRCPARFSPHFLSLSQAVPLVESLGFPYEYVPSRQATEFEPQRWHAYFRARLNEAIRRLRPAAVVFDGTWPYEGIRAVQDDHPTVPWVWCRRGMWKAGMNADQLAKAGWFDLVIEPGDLAASADQGVTVEAPATRVRPITLLDRDELLGRTAARSELGLPEDAKIALVTLGAGNINDTSSALRIVVDGLIKLNVVVCVTQSALAVRDHTFGRKMHGISAFPLSRYLPAFDLAVSAAGYNSYHELLRFGVPTLFIPNMDTALDDQRARAAHAASQGWAHSIEVPTLEAVIESMTNLVEHGREMVARVASVDPGNGARVAIDAVVDVIAARGAV